MTDLNTQELREKHYNATVVSIREVNPELRIFRIKPDSGVPKHIPGQYGTLGMGNWEQRVEGAQEESLEATKLKRVVKRAYSLSHPILGDKDDLFDPTGKDWVEVYIVLVLEASKEKPPALTPRLFTLTEGDRVFMGEKITGHYTLEPVKPDDTVIFLSTGTGEAPHNYMTWSLLCNGHRGKILGACCVRYNRDLGYMETQEKLMARYPNYHYIPLTTRENPDQKKVYIQDLIQSGTIEEKLSCSLDPETTHVYLCGNPKMIGVPEVDKETGESRYPKDLGVVEILERKGFHRDNRAAKIHGSIHFEEYW
ncbi:MAG: ferredoxin--NADP reductase [Gemmataceae bacterium]